ncbi:hypothetical protein Vafri_13348 [Volvox africanus]|nr:hypothetical protein Vafri_13348 [Volvox africanus]
MSYPPCLLQALAAQIPSPFAPDSVLLAASLAAAPPTDRGPLPPSYRTVTTDPVFRPLAGSTQQYAPGPPQLRSRHLTLNPLHGLAAWAGAHAHWLDLAFAYGSFSASVGGTFNQSGGSMTR